MMTKFMYRVITMLLVVLLCTGAFVGCASTNGGSTDAETVGTTNNDATQQTTAGVEDSAVETTTSPTENPTEPTTEQTTETTIEPTAKPTISTTTQKANPAPKPTDDTFVVGLPNGQGGSSLKSPTINEKGEIVYTYTDGTTGTEPRDGATYVDERGVTRVYRVYYDEVGRVLDSNCKDCGRKIKYTSYGEYCAQYKVYTMCKSCAETVPPYTCHTCTNYVEGITYCSDCKKVEGDGTNGTCVQWTLGGGGDKTCLNCNATVPMYTCHTCGVPIDMSMPGTAVCTPGQLTASHKQQLVEAAKSHIAHFYGDKYNETFVSCYALVLNDRTGLSSKSDCVCFFVFTRISPNDNRVLYHKGEIIDMSIREGGSVSYRSKSEEFTCYADEAEVVARYQAMGHSIVKIS